MPIGAVPFKPGRIQHFLLLIDFAGGDKAIVDQPELHAINLRQFRFIAFG
jgi:hypothetical protein